MAPATRRVTPTLGIIWPDDGQVQPDYEVPRLGSWPRERDAGRVGVAVTWSRAGRFHTHADLAQTASLDNLVPAARRLAEAGCGALIWACTSGSFIGGLAWARAQARALAEASGVPASSTTLAIIEAMHALGAERADLLGAYPEPVTAALADCLREAGLEVAAMAALGSPEGSTSFRLDLPREVRRFADAHPPAGHPLIIPDTAINSLDVVERLEDIAARPVLTANQATLWHGVRMLGAYAPQPGLGALFRAPG